MELIDCKRESSILAGLHGMMVYVAAPYTNGNTAWNVRRACEAADRLVGYGVIPVVPHLNHLWDLISPQEHTPDFWYRYDLAFLARCDSMVVLTGSENSAGVQMERKFAAANDIPVYEWEELW